MKYSLFSSLDKYWSHSLGSSFLPWLLLVVWVLVVFGSIFFLNQSKVLFSQMRLIIENGAFLPENFKFKFFSSFIYSTFLVMFFKKLFGLFPYYSSGTSQMVFTLSLALTIWLVLITSSLFYSPKAFLSHLVPSGSPLLLAPILVMIEGMSNIIRPLTLSLRLAMNMTTGHMLLSLISMSLVSMAMAPTMFNLSCVMLMASGYIVFELCMAFIQAFVFSLLCSQYLGEHS